MTEATEGENENESVVEDMGDVRCLVVVAAVTGNGGDIVDDGVDCGGRMMLDLGRLVVVRFEGDNDGWRSWMCVPVVVAVGLAREEEKVKEERERKKGG